VISNRTLQRLFGMYYGLLPGKPRQDHINELLSLATSIEVTDPARLGTSAVLVTLVEDDILMVRDLLKIEEGLTPVVGSKVEGLRLRILQNERLVGEIRYFVSRGILLPSWNSKAVFKQPEAFLDWLRRKGVQMPWETLAGWS
jgi:hypothetical protein